MNKFLIVIFIIIVILISFYSISCEEEKVQKLNLLRASRTELADAESAVLSCENDVRALDTEIGKLRDIIKKKKIKELRTCGNKILENINIYKTLYNVSYDKDITMTELRAMLRKIGIDPTRYNI